MNTPPRSRPPRLMPFLRCNLELAQLGLSPPSHVRENGTFVQRPSLTVSSASEEHDVVYLPKRHRPPSLGIKFDIYPNYVSDAVNLFDKLWIVQGDNVKTTWNITARGKSV